MKSFVFKHMLLTLIILSSFYSAFAYDVVVAKDSSGDFISVQAAINAAPDGRTTPYTILIKNGKYKEKINVPLTKPFLQFIGESVANVILTYDDYSGKPMPGGGTFGTGNSASVTIEADDFTAINITFENTTGEAPQALAINVTGDKVAFKNCRFLGGQDTVYAGQSGARQYFRNCYIDGTVDFIFGDARAVFDSCVIYAKTRSSPGASYITAANTKQAEPYGYVFRDCMIPANRGESVYYLGRPWQNDANTAEALKSYNKTIFLNTTMSSSIQPAGWSTWDAGTDVIKITYAEYRSKKFDSTLVDVSQRILWSKQLTPAEATNYYNNSNLFGSWDPCIITADFCTSTPATIAVSNFKGVKGTSSTSFTWNISWPIGGVRYEILRSINKITFTKVSEQISTNDSTVNYTYSENVPPPGITYYYLIQASKAGYNTHISDTVSISSTPTIKVTGSFGSFIQGVGTPSTSQSYVVSASSLTNNLILTAPLSFELSTNGTTFITSDNSLELTPDDNGNIANTSIFVRLNATSAGTYSGNIIHSSTGADTLRLAATGTAQSAPLTVSALLEWWPFTTNNLDSTAVRSAGVTGTFPTLNNLYVSNGTSEPAVPAYSPTFGQAFGGSANGDGTWTTEVGGPGGNLSRVHYEQFVIKASATHSLRIDSLILSSSFYNTSNNIKLALAYSKRGFTTADSVDISSGLCAGCITVPPSANGDFATPVLLTNEVNGTTVTYRFAISVDSLRNLVSGDSLTIRLYYATCSDSAGRYAKLKNVQVKGLATANPITGDYRTHQSGDWTDVNTWERYEDTAWIYPAPTYPVYNNSNTTKILNGHTVTIYATLTNGSGFIRRTTINSGGQLIVNSAANLNIANDGVPSTATTDLGVDGTFTLFGGLFTNGNVSVVINGNFVNSGTNMNLSNPGDTINVGSAATYQHNVNSNSTPANMIWQTGSTFLITGITTNQTDIFKKAIKYSNIIWNNAGQANYYAFRSTLDSSNVKGSFTVQSTGTTYISFANASGRTSLAGGYYQTGGTVNYKENGNVSDTLDIGGDFSVTGGSFISNTGTGSSLLIRLNGFNKSLNYSQLTATNTNWEVNGSYNLGTKLSIPSEGFGVMVKGGLLNTSSTRYVVTNGVGTLKMYNISTGNRVFAIGPTAISYNPATINNEGVPDNFSVTVKTTFDNPVPDPNRIVNRQWIINEDVMGGSNATVSLAWTTADQAPGFNPDSACSIIRFNGTSWESYAATISGTGTTEDPYVATATGITAFSSFTIINSSALPLNKMVINAGYVNDNLTIWWKATYEKSTASYEVERSVDGVTFTTIGSIAAKNTTTTNTYSIPDGKPINGVVNYRLRSIDRDGSFRYSKRLTVNSRLIGTLTIYPNPATKILSITHDRAGNNATIEVAGIDDKKMITQKMMPNTTQSSIDVSKLAAGVYILIIRNEKENSTIKFIKH